MLFQNPISNSSPDQVKDPLPKGSSASRVNEERVIIRSKREEQNRSFKHLEASHAAFTVNDFLKGRAVGRLEAGQFQADVAQWLQGIVLGGRTLLHVFDAGTINAQRYRDENLEALVSEDIRHMDWPSNLNQYEYVWDDLGRGCGVYNQDMKIPWMALSTITVDVE
ncbi:hypothetical protein TNCV_4140731 [Trichonephila clavipes]|nr:hypothetical protein TNCV_4140731 [Trichonephila clavipes]